MKKYFKFAAVILVLLTVCLFCGCSFFSGLGAAQEKEFSKAGMSITLTDDFTEQDIVSQTAVYASAKHIVMALKEEYALFEEIGDSLSLQEYAQLVCQNNDLTADIEEKDGLVCFEYENEANGRDFAYFAVVQKGTDAYWLFQFSCDSSNYEDSKEQFIDWAKTIRFE